MSKKIGKLHSLTREELDQLLRVAYADSKRNHLMLLVGFTHGLRASEVVGAKGLTVDSVNGDYLTVERLKHSYGTVHSLKASPDPVYDEKTALKDYVAYCRETKQDRLFPITRQMFWKICQKYGEKAGLPPHKRHPHVLKHTVAKFAIKEAGIEVVQKYLGHKSINSTAQYLKVDEEEACNVMQAALGK